MRLEAFKVGYLVDFDVMRDDGVKEVIAKTKISSADERKATINKYWS